jgi:citrate/tricarballylate utilization protein
VQPLEALVRQATALGSDNPALLRAPMGIDEGDAARMLQICNACRYCEGFCAVFPAMTRRLEFPRADVHYLANLCHNCSACLHACQYALPHEFAVDLPRALARVRQHTWADHAWPQAFAGLYRRNGLTLALALVAALALFLLLAAAQQGSLWRAVPAGEFYRVFPHGLMVALFTPVFVFALAALAIGVRRFHRGLAAGPAGGAATREATRHVLALTYLDGGHGEGCNEGDDAFTLARRRAHHLAFYGFMLCFAATSVATVYHYAFGWSAPYAWTSLPKLLGVTGGVALTFGCTILWRLHHRREARQRDAALVAMDRGFIALLFATASSGLVLAVARHTPALALLLSVHLACVMALFLTMPYSKFAHGVFRAAALLKWSIEKRQGAGPDLGDA